MSIPLLLNDRHIGRSSTYYGQPGCDTRVITDERDVSVEEARSRFSDVSEDELRRHSYAVLLYERLRCSYAHHYLAGKDTVHIPGSNHSVRVDYFPRSAPTAGGYSRIYVAHFHLPFLVDLAKHLVENLAETPEVPPTIWWCPRRVREG